MAAVPTAYAQSLQGTGGLSLGVSEWQKNLGIKAGNTLLLPAGLLGYTFDSNVFHISQDDGYYDSKTGQWHATDIVPGHLLSVGLGFGLKNTNTKNVAVELDARASYDFYASSNEALKAQNGIKIAPSGLKATFFRASPVSWVLFDKVGLNRMARDSEGTGNYNRFHNEVGTDLVVAPGGKALQILVGYSFKVDMFTDVAGDWGDLYVHDIRLNAAWKFFPKTAVVLEGDFQIRDYLEDPGNYGELTDNKPLRIRLGLTGFVTKKLSIGAFIGYGNSFHKKRDPVVGSDGNPIAPYPDENNSFNMVIGEVRLSVQFKPNLILQGGYRYDFRDDLFVNYVAYHQLYLNFAARLAKRLTLSLDFGYFNLRYSQLPAAYGGRDSTVNNGVKDLVGLSDRKRVDHQIVGQLKAVVDITRWLAFEALYRLELLNEPINSNPFGACLNEMCNVAGTHRDYSAYQRHLVTASFIFRY
jgi:hypothetical protein